MEEQREQKGQGEQPFGLAAGMDEVIEQVTSGGSQQHRVQRRYAWIGAEIAGISWVKAPS